MTDVMFWMICGATLLGSLALIVAVRPMPGEASGADRRSIAGEAFFADRL